MRKQTIEPGEESRAEWDTLEAFARQGVQRLVLEEEVDELLGRGRYERRLAVDAPSGLADLDDVRGLEEEPLDELLILGVWSSVLTRT